MKKPPPRCAFLPARRRPFLELQIRAYPTDRWVSTKRKAGHFESDFSRPAGGLEGETGDSGANRHVICFIPPHADVDPAWTFRAHGESSEGGAAGFGVGVVPGAKARRGRCLIHQAVASAIRAPQLALMPPPQSPHMARPCGYRLCRPRRGRCAQFKKELRRLAQQRRRQAQRVALKSIRCDLAAMLHCAILLGSVSRGSQSSKGVNGGKNAMSNKNQEISKEDSP
jgi:hypothetical protein